MTSAAFNGLDCNTSARVDYHLRAFHESRLADPDNPQPVYARAIRRVFHDSDPNDTGETIEVHEYSDGFGRLLQTRTQGESVRFGDRHFGGGNNVLPADQDAPSTAAIVGTENNDANHPNVIVSGWQRYDKKDQIIEKFEPFYATGWRYQAGSDAQTGKSVTMYYDPRGQVVRTVNPDDSEQRVILGIQPHIRYAHHYNTPASIEVDALGRTIRGVARYRETPTSSSPAGLLPIEEHVTRSTTTFRAT